MKRIFAAFLCFAALAAFAASPDPITPVFQGTTTISVTNASAATALPASVQFQHNVELQNAGTGTVFVEFGTSTTTAAVASGYPVLAGQSKVVTIPSTVTHIATIDASGTQTFYVTIGVGQ